jgi:hypothetical protein
VLLVALPRGLGHLVLGSLWLPTYPLVLPAIIAVLSGCATNGALLGLHALGAARRSLRAVIITSVVIIPCAFVGAKTGGTLGTMRYVAAASWLGTLVCWWHFRQALHESGTVPVPRWLWPGRQPGSSAADSDTTAAPEKGLPRSAKRAADGNAASPAVVWSSSHSSVA